MKKKKIISKQERLRFAINFVVSVGLAIFVIIPNKTIDTSTPWWIIAVAIAISITLYCVGNLLIAKIKTSSDRFLLLKKVQQNCLDQGINISTIEDYTNQINEPELYPGSYVLLLVNDIVKYDMRNEYISTMAKNLDKGVYYVYFYPKDSEEVRNNIEPFMQKLMTELTKDPSDDAKKRNAADAVTKYLIFKAVGQKTDFSYNFYITLIRNTNKKPLNKNEFGWYLANATNSDSSTNFIMFCELSNRKDKNIVRGAFAEIINMVLNNEQCEALNKIQCELESARI